VTKPVDSLGKKMFSRSQENGTFPEEKSQFRRFGEETLFKLQNKKARWVLSPLSGLFFRLKCGKVTKLSKWRAGRNFRNKITKCS
jgi:hypothetical protein